MQTLSLMMISTSHVCLSFTVWNKCDKCDLGTWFYIVDGLIDVIIDGYISI